MELSFSQKSLIYIVALVVAILANFVSIAAGIGYLVILSQFFPVLIHIWMSYVIYHDAPERGLNENWWVVQFLLGPLGLAIYYIRVTSTS